MPALFQSPICDIFPSIFLICHLRLCTLLARSMWDQVKKAYKEQEDDIHSRLMKQNYEFIPQWWFYLVLFSMVNLAILTCQVNEQVQLSCWGFLIIFAMVSILLLPNAVLISTTANSVRWIYHFLFRLTW